MFKSKKNTIYPNRFLLLLLPLILFSCGKEVFFEEMIEIPNQTWKHNDMVQFNVPVEDTINTFDFFINIRHTKSYEYSNLWIFVHTVSPEGRRMTDTLHLPMADPEGNYVGKVSGGLVMNRVIIKTDVRFLKPGEYKFIIEQAMRDESLREISDVGLSIIKKQ